MSIRRFTEFGPSPQLVLWAVLSVATMLAFAGAESAASTPETGSTVAVDLTDSPDPVTLGNNLTYTATVGNGGPDAATNAVVSIGVPEGSRFVSSKLSIGSSERSCPPDENGRIECRIGDLGVGDEATLTLVVRPTQVGTLYNTAAAGAENNRAVTTNPVVNTAVVAPEYCTVVGTEHADRLVGTSGRDVVCAFSGDDEIYGGKGDDVVYGEGGADMARGGDGEDELVGGRGGDELFGGPGDDTLLARDGVEGNDVARGGDGRDTISADRRDNIED